MKKISRYVKLLTIEEGSFIYNLVTGMAIALHPELNELISRWRNNIEELDNVHPQLLQALEAGQMIVSDDISESDTILAKFEDDDNNPKEFEIIVNPTLDCNLRCWYCYEKHGKGTMMSPNVQHSIINLITNKIADSRLEKLQLSFFGGEPLIGWDKVVMPLLTFASSQCKLHGVKLTASFTTNGVLLSDSKLCDLKKLGITDTFFQITLDGNRYFHNQTRIGENKKPTYDRIIANVKSAAKEGFRITLRFNYTQLTVDSFADVLSEIESLPQNIKTQIECNFHQVWQTVRQDSGSRDRAIKAAEIFNNYDVASNCASNYGRQVCYADRYNCVVVNYNGDLFKCTARDFSNEKREGELTSDGHLQWNERFTKRMSARYSNPTCRNCDILPICNGSCTQNKLERGPVETCYLEFDDDARKRCLIGSFYQRITGKTLSESELINKSSNAIIS